MTYHGMVTLSLLCFLAANISAFLILSPCSWNRLFLLGRPMSKHPLGAELPRRVPWPPAMSTTATLFSAIRSSPLSYHLSRSSWEDERTEDVAFSGRGSSLFSLASVSAG